MNTTEQIKIEHASWFNEEYLKNNNFKKVSDDGQYGIYESIKPNGYRTLAFNREGISLSYEGNQLEPNIFMEIRLDAGTRVAFNGVIYNGEQFKEVLNLIR